MEIKLLEELDLQDKNKESLTESLLKANKLISEHKEESKVVTRKWERKPMIDCPYDDCTKQYSTQQSLQLHIRRKHNGGPKRVA